MMIAPCIREADGDYARLMEILLRVCEANPRAAVAHALNQDFVDTKLSEILCELRRGLNLPQDPALTDGERALLQTVFHKKINDESIVQNLISSASVDRTLTDEQI